MGGVGFVGVRDRALTHEKRERFRLSSGMEEDQPRKTGPIRLVWLSVSYRLVILPHNRARGNIRRLAFRF